MLHYFKHVKNNFKNLKHKTKYLIIFCSVVYILQRSFFLQCIFNKERNFALAHNL